MPSTLPNALNKSNPYEKIRSDYNQIARLQYPLDMGRYYIAFEFAEYGPSYSSGASDFLNVPVLASAADAAVTVVNNALSDFNANISLSAVRAQTNKYALGDINAAIALPVPSNLVDDQQLDYNAQNLLNVAGQATSAAAQAITGPGSTVASKIGSSVSVAQAVGNFQSVFTGQAINPFLAMMFTGPRFKTHQFGWRFSPKSEDETNQLVRIINTFKAKALPVQWAGGTLFNYPDVALISLYPSNARSNMYKFKPAVIQQVSVNYAPSGTPAFFAGSNAPAEIELKLQLSEISIWTRNDLPGYDIPTGDAGR